MGEFLTVSPSSKDELTRPGSRQEPRLFTQGRAFLDELPAFATSDERTRSLQYALLAHLIPAQIGLDGISRSTFPSVVRHSKEVLNALETVSVADLELAQGIVEAIMAVTAEADKREELRAALGLTSLRLTGTAVDSLEQTA